MLDVLNWDEFGLHVKGTFVCDDCRFYVRCCNRDVVSESTVVEKSSFIFIFTIIRHIIYITSCKRQYRTKMI